MGPCAGGAVYAPAMTDFIFMVNKTSHMFVTGPDVVKTVTHEEVSHEELSGATTHTTKSSVADLAFDDDIQTLIQARRFLDFSSQNNKEFAQQRKTDDSKIRTEVSLDSLVPTDSTKPYDMLELIIKVVDESGFF